MKKITYIVLTIVVIAGFIAIITGDSTTSNTKSPSNNSSTSKTTIDNKTDLIIGRTDAKVTLTEFGDFKCPSCNQFHHQAGKQLRQDYIDQGKLRIVFRTMTFIGPDSKQAAVGAYCANDQKKFTEYHDAIYNYMWDNYYNKGDYSAEAKNILTKDKLVDLGGTIGLEQVSFASCLKSSDHDNEVSADADLASNAGVSGTPTFVINNQKISGPQPYSVFKQLVDIQLQ
jgi:protein-disulfide isomerase